MDESSYQRRRIIKALGVAGLAGIAGCSGDGNNQNGGSDGSDGDDGDDGSDGGDGGGGDGSDGSDGGGSETRTLEFAAWGPEVEKDAHKGALDSFKQQKENLETNYINIPPDQFHDRIRTQFSAGEEPHVFYMEPIFIPEFAENLVVQGEEHPDDFVGDFYQNIVDAYRFKDTLYNMPFTWAITAPVYDKELLSTAGYDELPKNWGDFRTALVDIKEKTDVDYPLYQPDQASSPVNLWHPLLVSNGGQVMTDDLSECVVGSDEAVEALAYMEDLRESNLIGLLSEVGAQSDMAALAKGQVAMITGGGWLPAFIKTQHPDLFDRLGTARPPKPSGGEFGNMVFAASMGISANSEVKDTALEFVRHILGDGMIPYYESGIGFPVREHHRKQLDLYDKDGGDPRWKNMFQIRNDRLRGFIWGENTPEIKNTLYGQIEGVMRGSLDAQEALEQAEKTINNDVLN